MKKTLAVAIGAAVLSGQALATKARLIALGEDSMGSFYIEDNRNIFLNAATVNRHKDLVTFEWGSTGGNDSNSKPDSDTDTNPKAEGGILVGANNFVYGVHLGSEDDISRQRRYLTGLNSLPQIDNAVDLFIGGDAGILWGANVLYSSSEDESTEDGATPSEQDAIAVRLGAISGPIEGFINAVVLNEAEATAANKFEGKLGIDVGVSYMFNEEYKTWVNYRKSDWDYTKDGVSGEAEASTYRLGIARIANLNDKAKLFTKVEATHVEVNVDTAETTTTNLPITIGLEVDALTWLSLRGSVSQDIVLNESENALGQTNTDDNSTNVNAGASLKFGDLTLDGLIGTGNNGGAVASSQNEQGVLSTDNLLTRVSMSYKF